MKTLFFVLCITFFTNAYSQDSVKYCELIGIPRSGLVVNEKYNLILNAYSDNKSTKLSFEYPIDALNALGKQGWVLVSVFSVSIGAGLEAHHYILLSKCK